MKIDVALFRKSGPWLALAIPIGLYGLLALLSTLEPSLFCVAVNPGGKEFVCGSRYSHGSVRILQSASPIVWLSLLGVSGKTVLTGRATKASTVAWSISIVLFLALVVLWLLAPVEDAP
jgi:hypothetical protein